MTLKEIIDQAQSQMHDPNAVVWSRAELLRWAQDGYRELLYTSGCCIRPFQIDLPGRVAATVTHDWETNNVPGTTRNFTRAAGNRFLRVTYLWEPEQLESVIPTNAFPVVTQLWEQVHSGDTDSHFRFALPRQSDRPLKVYWDSKRLAHTSVRELDQSFERWWRDTGEPIATTPGVGPEKSLEVYLLQTTYVQSYRLNDFESGLPRQFSSDASRTYAVTSPIQTWDYAYTNSPDSGMLPGLGLNIAPTFIEAGVRGLFSWEANLTATTNDQNQPSTGIAETYDWEIWIVDGAPIQMGVGVSRTLSSSDRQYIGVSYDSGQDLVGLPRRFASSSNALTIWHSIVPDRPLVESDTPDLLPTQVHKYIKFYVLAQALSRTGQGHRPDLAQHYAALYQLGVGLLAILGTPSILDRVYAREQVRDASIQAPPRVRLPATFPVEGRFL